MHFLSDHEYVAFLEAWWDTRVSDIREQYPLNLRHTLTIAGQLGVRHPVDTRTGILLTQTTDILLTNGHGEHATYTAWAVKDRSQLTDRRTMEKLSIEQRYWHMQNVPWKLVVNDGLNTHRALNLNWLFQFENALRGNSRARADCVSRVLARVQEGRHEVAGTACRCLDERWGTDPGAHLSAFRFLLLTRIVVGNLDLNSLSRQPLCSFEVAQ